PEQSADALFEQAQAAEETGNIAEAERLYRVLMKCDRTDAAAPFNLGNMLRASGRKVEAEAAFRAATRADPMFAEAWYNLSDLLDEQGRSQAAVLGRWRRARRRSGSFGASEGRSIAKFLDLRLCAPFAESLRVKGKLALAIKQFVGDLAHARGIFEDHSIRTLEIEEPRRG